MGTTEQRTLKGVLLPLIVRGFHLYTAVRGPPWSRPTGAAGTTDSESELMSRSARVPSELTFPPVRQPPELANDSRSESGTIV